LSGENKFAEIYDHSGKITVFGCTPIWCC